MRTPTHGCSARWKSRGRWCACRRWMCSRRGQSDCWPHRWRRVSEPPRPRWAGWRGPKGSNLRLPPEAAALPLSYARSGTISMSAAAGTTRSRGAISSPARAMGQFSDVSTIVLWRPALQRVRSVAATVRTHARGHIAGVEPPRQQRHERTESRVLLTSPKSALSRNRVAPVQTLLRMAPNSRRRKTSAL